MGVTALSSVAAHGILNYANHERDISNADRVASREGFHSEQLIHAFSSSVVPWVLELHYITLVTLHYITLPLPRLKSLSQRVGIRGLLWRHRTALPM